MLVLTRKTGQAVRITTEDGREVTVTVTSAGEGWARLGFEAPDSVRVLRTEIITEG